MRRKPRKIIAIDCETDKFLHGRMPAPFIWGAYDGATYRIFHETADFVAWIKTQYCYAYAHNGGKFDHMYLLPYLEDDENMKLIGGRIAELKLGQCVLRDSYSIFPVPLATIHKDSIDYDLMEKEVRDENMPEIIAYLKTDVRVLWLLVTRFREEAGTAITLASNAMKSSKKLGRDPGRTNVRFDRRFREFYFGGRTQCELPGTHHEICVYDIRSSYPFAMVHDHPSGSISNPYKSFDDIDPEAHGRCFVELSCYSHGAFPLRCEKTHSMMFPKTEAVFKVTGWEYLIAKKHGLLKNVNIRRIEHFEKKINFDPYVRKWFEHKERHRARETLEEKVQYEIGKRLMCSLYGKLAMNPLTYFDWKIVEPGTPVDYENGWREYVHFQDREIHRRSVKWDLKYKYGKAWEKRPIFYNVATGASITGFARAKLLDAIHICGPERFIYCDTDSVILKGYDAPKGLDLSPELGAWDCEGEFQIGHFNGKKLYGMKSRQPDDKTGEFKYKIACKGSKLEFDDMVKIVKGGEVYWKSEAPTFSISKGGVLDCAKNQVDVDKFFVNRRIRATHPAALAAREEHDNRWRAFSL